MIAVGEKIPDVPLTTVDAAGNTESVRSGELFASGRTVLFGVPAAFSPTIRSFRSVASTAAPSSTRNAAMRPLMKSP